jgi:hypothetical protein
LQQLKPRCFGGHTFARDGIIPAGTTAPGDGPLRERARSSRSASASDFAIAALASHSDRRAPGSDCWGPTHMPSCIAFLADPRPHRAWPPLKRGAESARPRFDCQEAGGGYPEYSFRFLIANQDAGEAHSPGRTTHVFAYSGIRQTAILSSTPQSWWRYECPDPPRYPPPGVRRRTHVMAAGLLPVPCAEPYRLPQGRMTRAF